MSYAVKNYKHYSPTSSNKNMANKKPLHYKTLNTYLHLNNNYLYEHIFIVRQCIYSNIALIEAQQCFNNEINTNNTM